MESAVRAAGRLTRSRDIQTKLVTTQSFSKLPLEEQLKAMDAVYAAVEVETDLGTVLKELKKERGLKALLEDAFIEVVQSKVEMYRVRLREQVALLRKEIEVMLRTKSALGDKLGDVSFNDMMSMNPGYARLVKEADSLAALFSEFVKSAAGSRDRPSNEVDRMLSGFSAVMVLKGRTKPGTELKIMFKTRYKDLVDAVEKLVGDGGLNDARYSINSLVARLIMTFSSNPLALAQQHLNVILMGAAGSGKTRYAKLIAKIMSSMGLLLSSTPFVTASKAELVGEAVGETAPKTQDVLNKSLESVLFIDEAYSLTARYQKASGVGDEFDPFGAEAITTIVNFLDKNKGSICVIAAGYEKQMLQDFLKANEGMPRRFPYQVILASYTPDELVDIFNMFLRDMGFQAQQSRLDKAAREFLKKLLNEQEVRDTLFANSAGDIENLAAVAVQLMSADEDQKIGAKQMKAIVGQYCITSKNKYCDFGGLAGGGGPTAPQPHAVHVLSTAGTPILHIGDARPFLERERLHQQLQGVQRALVQAHATLRGGNILQQRLAHRIAEARGSRSLRLKPYTQQLRALAPLMRAVETQQQAHA
jgi:hypothetical protein